MREGLVVLFLVWDAAIEFPMCHTRVRGNFAEKPLNSGALSLILAAAVRNTVMRSRCELLRTFMYVKSLENAP